MPWQLCGVVGSYLVGSYPPSLHRTLPGELISGLKSIWALPYGLSLPARQEGAHPGFPLTQIGPKSPVLGHGEVRCVSTPKSSSRAPKTLLDLENQGRGEMGRLAWDWETF